MKKLSLFAAALALAGCFTIHESPDACVEITRLPEDAKIAVSLSGFEAFFTSYTPVRSYTTVWEHSPSYYRHGHYHPGGMHPATYSSVTYVPHEESTGNVFMDRAIEILDDAGVGYVTDGADYAIELKFSGPFESGYDQAKELCTVLLSIFTADYSVQTWKATVKVRDVKSGRLVFRHEYTERSSAAVWGPIPIFSPAFADATDEDRLRTRALASLTDRAMADALKMLQKWTK